MKFLSRVVWSEGMHLGPHHFQTQSRYFEDTLWFLSSNLRQHPWGFLHFQLDAEAMRNGMAILTFGSGIFPDGLIFDVPDCDQAPAAVNLNTLFTATDSEILLYLAIPPRQDQGLDCDLGASTGARYSTHERNLRDESLGQGEFNVMFARKNLQLLSHNQITKDVVSLPIARVIRDGAGGFVCDVDFIPPCLRLSASESLVLLLHRLGQALDEKITATRSSRQGGGAFELGTSALDVANYWFLHSLCSAQPAFRHHLADRRSHPEEVYRDLARMAGALSTFALEATGDEIPPYRHEDLSTTFQEMNRLIRRYLEVVAPSNSVRLQFHQSQPLIFTAEVKDERCFRRSRWILGVRSGITESTLLRQAPVLVKVCSAEGVVKLVQRALPGLELLHVPVPPAALHAQADMHYFSISQNGPCWQHILQTKLVGVYLPGELGDAVFELTVITEANG